MFNLKFFKSLKEALDTKANLLTFASSQRKANEEYGKTYRHGDSDAPCVVGCLVQP